jgi:mRNA-degrading endonuclease RelE of RelBE toxin-antitoxin system
MWLPARSRVRTRWLHSSSVDAGRRVADELYEVVLSPGARRALTDELPPAVAFAAWEFITGPLRQRPRVVGSPLRPPFEGLWRARRGEYRVQYRIDDDLRRVVVLDIDHRRDAYR